MLKSVGRGDRVQLGNVCSCTSLEGRGLKLFRYDVKMFYFTILDVLYFFYRQGRRRPIWR